MKYSKFNLLKKTVFYGRILPFLTVLYFVMTSVTFATPMYKWMDSEGNIQYTQKPPPAGTEYSTIKPPPRIDAERSQKGLERRQKHVDALRDQRLKTAEGKRIADEEKARQKKNCEKAKARLATYTRPRVQIVQEDGSRIRATEEERQQQIKKSKEMIEEFCK